MIDPDTVKVGDRLIWHRRFFKHTYVVQDGHGATVIEMPKQDSDGDILVSIKWDPGTDQPDGSYFLENFDREELRSTQISNRCSCEEPNLVENCVAGNKFFYCRKCKKER